MEQLFILLPWVPALSSPKYWHNNPAQGGLDAAPSCACKCSFKMVISGYYKAVPLFQGAQHVHPQPGKEQGPSEGPENSQRGSTWFHC